MKTKHDKLPRSADERSGPTDTAAFKFLAAAGTIVTPAWVAFIAHYELGFSRQEIRTPAVAGAIVIGLLLATECICEKFRRINSTKSRELGRVE